MDVALTSPAPPNWWLVQTGSCRSGAITVVADALGDTPGCAFWAGPSPVVPVYNATTFFMDPNQQVIQLAAVVPAGSERSYDRDREYQFFRVRIAHTKSTGSGACTGCTVPACIGFGRFDVVAPDGGYESHAGAGLDAVTWQGAYVAAYPTQLHDPPTTSTLSNFLQCTLPPVPAQSRTWGTIKSLYR